PCLSRGSLRWSCRGLHRSCAHATRNIASVAWDMSASMRAITVSGSGLVIGSVPQPVLRHGEAMLEVYGSALNRAVLSQAAGHYPPPAGESEILGLEAAGVVVAAPAAVHWLGRSACALLAGGGYAERVAVPAGMLLPVP